MTSETALRSHKSALLHTQKRTLFCEKTFHSLCGVVPYFEEKNKKLTSESHDLQKNGAQRAFAATYITHAFHILTPFVAILRQTTTIFLQSWGLVVTTQLFVHATTTPRWMN